MPGWQATPVGLEELILAYLRRPEHLDTGALTEGQAVAA
jgi:hypothetical protein